MHGHSNVEKAEHVAVVSHISWQYLRHLCSCRFMLVKVTCLMKKKMMMMMKMTDDAEDD